MKTQDIIDVTATTEVRMTGTTEWIDLCDAPQDVIDTVTEQVIECMCRDMRHEESKGNTDDSGEITDTDGREWAYRR